MGFKRASQPSEQGGESISATLVVRVAAAAFILGVAAGFMRDTYSYHSADAFGAEYCALFTAGTIAAVLLLIAFIVTSKSFSIKLLYKPVILVCILGFVLTPSLGADTAVPYLLITIGYTVFEVVIWIMLCDMANRFQFTFVQVFGIGRAVTLAAGVVAGGLIARSVSDLTSHDSSFLILASGVAIGFIVISYLYILTENDLDAYDSELYGEDASNRIQKPEKEDDEAILAASAREAPKRVPLLERCKLVGAHYGLSRREIDVFHLLSLGRSAARILEELMISAGTVNTHTYPIYTKLEVHSQQELIDLMYESNLDEIEADLRKREG